MNLKVITSNLGKVREYEESLGHLGITMEHFKLPYDEVQTSDLEEVVAKGMEAIKAQGVRNFIIDDSGIFVDGLNGFPGVWSAYAQKTIGNKGILKLLENIENRTARFKCCIGCDIDDKTIIVTGECEGTILFEEKGDGGFGFDPIFSPDGKLSFSEIPLEEKNSMSHRGNAVRLLIEKLEELQLV